MWDSTLASNEDIPAMWPGFCPGVALSGMRRGDERLKKIVGGDYRLISSAPSCDRFYHDLSLKGVVAKRETPMEVKSKSMTRVFIFCWPSDIIVEVTSDDEFYSGMWMQVVGIPSQQFQDQQRKKSEVLFTVYTSRDGPAAGVPIQQWMWNRSVQQTDYLFFRRPDGDCLSVLIHFQLLLRPTPQMEIYITEWGKNKQLDACNVVLWWRRWPCRRHLPEDLCFWWTDGNQLCMDDAKHWSLALSTCKALRWLSNTRNICESGQSVFSRTANTKTSVCIPAKWTQVWPWA